MKYQDSRTMTSAGFEPGGDRQTKTAARVCAVLLPAIGSAPGIQEIKAKHGPIGRRARRLLLGLSLAFAGTAALAQGASQQIVQELDALEPDSAASALPLPRPTQPLQIRALAQSSSQRVPPRVIVLPELANAKAAPAPAPGQPLQIGVARALPNAADATVTASLLTWSRSADGSLRAAISVRAPGAKGLRLGLLVEQLPQDARLRVYAPDAAETIEIAAAEVLRTIQTNLNAGDHSADARTYWLPTVEGAEAALEIELPAGVSPARLKVSLPTVSHMVLLPTDTEAVARATGGSSSCNQDVMCTSGNETQMNAVAWMNFTERGMSYMCTGTLLNNTREDRTPYFLSANHCISSQTAASNLQTTWNYRSASCDSNQVSSAKQTLNGGAVLLYNSSRTDTSFMRLNGTPPSNAAFAGWNVNPVTTGTAVFGIHNPQGDLQKYSSGQISQNVTCTTLYPDGSFWCTPSTLGNFYNATFSIGITEGGSSGSALFTSSGRQVIGQLYGGNSACNYRKGDNYYGRFDLAYNAALKTWLSPTTGGGSAYTVTTSAGAGGTISPSGPVSVAPGQTQKFTVTPNAGYYIASIKGCGGTEFTGDSTSTAVRSYTTGVITSNCAVSASFAAIRTTSAYTVTVSAGAGGTISPPGPVSVAPGQTQKFTVTPDSGYYVASIKGCNGRRFLNADGSSFTYVTGAITSNCKVSASFNSYWNYR